MGMASTVLSCSCPACGGHGSFESRTYASNALSPDDYRTEYTRECRTCRGSGELTVDEAWILLESDLVDASPAFRAAWRAKWGDGPELVSTLAAPAAAKGAA
jgi:hypothetical protein